eukprot:15007501-Alexandrium_andersonii.AAC.1
MSAKTNGRPGNKAAGGPTAAASVSDSAGSPRRTSRATNTTPPMVRKAGPVTGWPAAWRTAAIDSTSAAGLELTN